MRAVFVGGGSFTLRTARTLLERKHEVVIVERSQQVTASVQEQLDCGCLLGDATRPRVMREVDPGPNDVLFCLTGNDQTNIIASLVGRSLGFPRVVTRINDEEFEHICIELGLVDTIIPARTIGQHLADMTEGQDILELSAAIRGEARVFLFVAGDAEKTRVDELDLPRGARVTHLYRAGELVLADPDTRLRRDDEVVVLTRREDLPKLRERWSGRS